MSQRSALQRRGQRHRRGVRAAAPQRRDAAVRPHALEARDDRVQPLGELSRRGSSVSISRMRAAPCAPEVRIGTCQPCQDRAGTPICCSASAIRPGGHLLAAGDDGVVFARIVEPAPVRARRRGRLAHPADELVRPAGHGRDDDGDVIAALDLAPDLGGRVADSLKVGERGPAEFHHQARHAVPSAARDLPGGARWRRLYRSGCTQAREVPAGARQPSMMPATV